MSDQPGPVSCLFESLSDANTKSPIFHAAALIYLTSAVRIRLIYTSLCSFFVVHIKTVLFLEYRKQKEILIISTSSSLFQMLSLFYI